MPMRDSYPECSGQEPDDLKTRSAPRIRLLVVDDEPSILELLKTALEAIGRYDVHLAQGPVEALRILDAAPTLFDAILLDIQMPQMTGIELCSVIRKRPGHDHIPILMLTAMSEREYLGDAFKAGASDYIAKPFDFLDLRMRISRSRQLERHRNRLDAELRALSGTPDRDRQNVPHSLEHRIRLNGVDRVIEPNAFETYVTLASRRKSGSLLAKAIKIQDAKRLFESMSDVEFLSVLEEVSKALSVTTKDGQALISYRGNGIFLCVSSKREGMDYASLNNALRKNRLLNDIASTSGLAVSVVIGAEVALDQAPEGQALFALNAAIEEVERSDPQTDSWSTYAQWKRWKQSRHKETAHIERRAYETLLQDFLLEQKRSTH